MRSSVPHTLQRYRTLILRISPDGGGGGIDEVIDPNMPNPNFQVYRMISRPTPTHTKVPKAGNASMPEMYWLKISRGVQ
jgi:hypothetical protein